ncbi:MAG: c-type cytochrome domain-containing protein [Pirellulaceae bacterium]
MRLNNLALLVCVTALISHGARVAAQDDPIQIAEIKREAPVDFQKEILPILRRNCLACHNSTEAESDLVLETPATILKGGSEGEGVVAGKPAESLLLLLASRQKESYMPPDGNDVGAKPLTPQELGLIKLWITEGAKGDVNAAVPIEWQPLPPGVNPIYAATVSADGRYAIAGRANQIFLYHLPSGRPLGRLVDPELQGNGRTGTAHLDLVQSLAVTRLGDRIVSGGFRNVKIWKKANPTLNNSSELSAEISTLGNRQGETLIAGLADGHVVLLPAGGSPKVLSRPSEQAIVLADVTIDGSHAISVDAANQLSIIAVATPEAPVASAALPAKAIALTAIANDRYAIALENTKEVAIWQLTIEEGKPPVLAAADQITGHAQPVTQLQFINNQLITISSADGDVRLWTPTDKKQIRQIKHGSAITTAMASADGVLLATANDKEVKIWNLADGKQLQHITADSRKTFTKDDLTRNVALGKRRVDLANGDLKTANDRKKAEEENAKKAKETLTKAEADLKTKTEAATKAVAEKDVEQKKVDEAVKVIAAADEATKKADESITAATKIKTDNDANVKKLQPQVTKLTEAEVFAQQSAEKAKQAAAILTDDKELATLALATQKAFERIKVNRADMAAEMTKQAAAATKATADIKTATDAKTKAAESKKAGEAAKKTAEAAVKAKDAPTKKAVDAKTAAERATTSAKRSIVRADKSVVRATEAIPPVEKTVQVEIEQHKGLEAELVKVAEVAGQPIGITQLTFSSDHLTLATISADGTVRLFDTTSGSELDKFAGEAGRVTFHSDALMFTNGKSLRQWSIKPTWQLERKIGAVDSNDVFVDRVTALAISTDQKLLAAGGGEPSRSGQIKLWNLETGELVREIETPHSDTVFSIDFSRDGKFLASSAADRFMKVFLVADGSFVRSFEGHTHHVLGVAWSADGRTLVTSGADNVVKVWNALTGDQNKTISGYKKEVTDIAYVGDTSEVVTASGDATVSRKSADGGNVRGFSGAKDFVYSVSSPADGSKVIAGGQDSILRVWNAADGKLLASFEPPAEPSE